MEAQEEGLHIRIRWSIQYSLDLKLEKIQDLRYGENPHQKAAYYRSQAHCREAW